MAGDLAARGDHVLCATLLLSGRSPGQIAGLFDISLRTVYDWTDRTFAYPEADALWRTTAGRAWTARRAKLRPLAGPR